MTLLDRRAFFGAAFAIMDAPPSSARSFTRTGLRRVSQREYDLAVAQHADWFKNSGRGQRVAFSHCDLSGLILSRDGEEVDLTGADFTGSSLRGCIADGLKFVSASVQDCDLSGSRFKKPVFSRSSLRRANCSNIVWGAGDARYGLSVTCAEGASFMDCYAGFSCFNHARIAGYFFNSTFHDSKFLDASLSGSNLAGNGADTRVSFAGCDLTKADFSRCRISGASFSNATLTGTSFADCDVGAFVRGLSR
jgi:uncharacterized protein YjbI with pentapeptide repeats